MLLHPEVLQSPEAPSKTSHRATGRDRCSRGAGKPTGRAPPCREGARPHCSPASSLHSATTTQGPPFQQQGADPCTQRYPEQASSLGPPTRGNSYRQQSLPRRVISQHKSLKEPVALQRRINPLFPKDLRKCRLAGTSEQPFEP